MELAIIKTPVYLRLSNDTLVRLLNVDIEKETYSFCDILTGAIKWDYLPIDASRLSFSISDRRDVVCPEVIEYLVGLNIHIDNFTNVPEWICARLLHSDEKAYQLIEALRYIENLNDIYVTYSEKLEANLIVDENVNNICSDILTSGSSFNQIRILRILHENGFTTKPLDFNRHGWDVAVIETKKGVVVFG